MAPIALLVLVRMFDMAGAYIDHMLLDSMLPVNPSEVVQLHQVLRQRFVDQSLQMLTCPKPWKWGNGLQQQAEHELAPLLVQHGIPADQAPNRAKAAIRAIGAQPILEALATRIPWKQWKTLGNQVKFQFLLPAELSAEVASSAGKGAVGRPKGGKKSQKVPVEERPPMLDPSKFGVKTGVFQASGHPLAQLPLTSVGPAAEGVVIVTKTEAAPYLANGKPISQLPLIGTIGPAE